MAGPWDAYAAPAGHPALLFQTQGSGPKPPSGYRATGDGNLSAIVGGPDDIAVAAQRARAEAAARSAIETSAAMQLIGARAASEVATHRQIRAIDDGSDPSAAGAAGLPRDQLVKALSDGRLAFPTGAAMRSPYWQSLLASVAQQDPAFDAVNYNARAATRRDFTSGKSAQNLRSLNTAIGHLGQLNSQIGGTAGHGGFPFATSVNAVENAMSRGAGNPGVTNFDQTAGAVASELTQVFRGSGGAEADVKRYLDELNSNQSTAQKQAAVRNIAGLLKSRMDEIGYQYQQGMGKTGDPLTVLNPHAAAAYQTLSGLIPGVDTGGGSQPPSGGTPPASGGPTLALATGSTRTEADPQTAKLIETMTRRGSSAEDINAALAAIGSRGTVSQQEVAAVQDALKKNPNYSGFVDATKDVPNSTFSQIAASPLGAGVVGAADAATGGLLDNLTSDPAATRAGMAALATAHPDATLVGNIVGGVGTAAGLEAGAAGLAGRLGGAAGAVLANPLTADAAYGALSGAGGADNGNRLVGAGVGALVGAGGGAAGRGAVGMFGRALRGVQPSADVAYLRAQNIPLTAGQIIGGPIKGVEDKLSSVPLVGDMVGARRREGLDAFNRAAFDQGLAPINASTNGLTQETGIDAARAARSRAYDATLNGVSLTPDAQFGSDYAAAVNAGRGLPDAAAGQTDYALRSAGQQVDPVTGQLSGSGFQQALRSMRRTASSNASAINGADIGDVLRQGEDAFTGLLGRQSPGTLADFNAANAANRNVEVLRDAVNRARNGSRSGEVATFTPSQLSDAAAANARRFGNSAGTTNQPFFDLTRAGQRVLPSKVPDSGTAGRLALLALPAALGGGTGAVGGDARDGTGAGLAVGAVLAAGGTRAGQQAITRALLDRPQSIDALGNAIYQRRMFGGALGAGTIPLLLQ